MALERVLVRLIVILALLTVAAAPMSSHAGLIQAMLYVTPGGHDGNPGTETKPFATIERARQEIRALSQQMTGDIVVVLGGGIYTIDHTLAFGPEDSGTNGYNVIYRAAANETPIISGGRSITGWKSDKKGRWKAPSPIGDFRQLYVDGVRAIRAHGNAPAKLELAGDDGYTTTTVDMADWKNPGDLEICYLTIWAHTRCKVESIKREGDHAVIAMLQPHFANAKAKEGVNVATPNQLDRIYLENALELLDEPGEWYLDRPAKMVYYMPQKGEDMTKAKVMVPAVEKLVELRGTLDRPVHNVQFEGIVFEYGSWLLPSKIGLVDVQANFVLDPNNPFNRNTGLITIHNEHLKSPSNVVCHAAKSVRFERCSFTKLGSGGIDLEYGSQDNVISGCRFFDISGTAIQVGDVLKDDHHPDDLRKIVKNNAITNNYIHDCGVDYWGSVAVFAGYTEGTVISHNEIANLPYSAISIGWGWGEEDAGGAEYDMPFKYTTPTPAKDNCIECNHIYGVMVKTDDGGGIYILGNMPGTVIRDNYIHDCKSPHSIRGWASGVYLDQGSGFIEITSNLVHGVPLPMTYNNKYQNRKATCNVHNNFFNAKPEDAKAVVEKAGLEPEYRDLLLRRH